MTEVPEHLLQRSRERRAALGLGGGEPGDEGSGATAAPLAGAAPPAPAASPAVATAAEAAGAEPAAAVPATIVEESAAPSGPPRKPGVPVYAMVLLAVLPVYAFIYLGAFGNRTKAAANDPVTLGGS